MRAKIVTSIYSDLYGTDLGGRPSRGGHYKHSLKSLLKMTDADFVCYTSEREIDDLKDFYYVQNNIPETQLQFKICDLYNIGLSEKINKLKNVDEVKNSDRCVEIQYSKFTWSLDELNIGDYDVIYWFDAGLSHCGLFPDKYMSGNQGYWETYYETKLFNNNFLKNLINFTGDKIILCAKENLNNYWSGTVPNNYYNNHCMDKHIIGGFFGGKSKNMENYCNIFINYANSLLDNEDVLYFEEHIMSLIYYNHPELFISKFFDIWWHEDAKVPGIDMEEYTKTRKSFYKIIEELNV